MATAEPHEIYSYRSLPKAVQRSYRIDVVVKKAAVLARCFRDPPVSAPSRYERSLAFEQKFPTSVLPFPAVLYNSSVWGTKRGVKLALANVASS